MFLECILYFNEIMPLILVGSFGLYNVHDLNFIFIFLEMMYN